MVTDRVYGRRAPSFIGRYRKSARHFVVVVKHRGGTWWLSAGVDSIADESVESYRVLDVVDRLWYSKSRQAFLSRTGLERVSPPRTRDDRSVATSYDGGRRVLHGLNPYLFRLWRPIHVHLG